MGNLSTQCGKTGPVYYNCFLANNFIQKNIQLLKNHYSL